jgi:sulfatase-like protein
VTLDVRDDVAGGLADGEELAESRAARRRARLVGSYATSVLAGLLVLFALAGPNQPGHFTPAALVRIPVEGLLVVGLLLVLPVRIRTVLAIATGVVLGLSAIVKIVDVGFFAVLDRPFDPVLDWVLLGAAVDFLTGAIGPAGAIAAVATAAVLALALLALTVLAVRRLSRLALRHRTRAAGMVGVLGAAWVGCALLGVQIVPGVPVAAHTYGRLLGVEASLRDPATFAAQLAVDGFRGAAGEQLLTALRGKDVVVAFVESYGRSALEDPELAAVVAPVLDAGAGRLAAAGYGSRSAFLTSPTAGGASWLAHATLLSGLWVDNQQRYGALVGSDRLTLNRLFQRAGWRTVAIVPGTTGAWPEAQFFGYDQVYDAHNLGYRGPRFSWARMPDQYTMLAFDRLERTSSTQRAPVMAEIPLVSSHAPWTPLPELVDWEEIGDGSGPVFEAMARAGESADVVLRDPARARDLYASAIAYTAGTLISYLETFGGDDLVMIILGDHQPAPLITGAGASHDVPITVAARDPAVLDRIAGWGWQEGLRPGPRAPVWPMDTFRDRFLTAFGPA